MSINEFYEKIGGDYEDVKNRFRSDEIIKRFLMKFPDERSYDDMQLAVKGGNMDEIIATAHRLKGVAANLSLSKLCEALTTLLWQLREEKRETLDNKLMQQITAYYNQIAETLKEI